MDVEAAGEEGADGAQDAFGFEDLAAVDDAGEGFIGADFEDFLRDDGAFVEVGGDEVGGDADDFDAAFVGLAIGVGAGERGQERGVNVDDFVFPAPDEVGREDFHEAREDDEVDFVLIEELEDLFFRDRAVVERDVVERELIFPGDVGEGGAVADDDDGLRAEAGGCFREEAFQDVRFLGDEDGKSLRTGGREMDLGFHVEAFAGDGDFLLDFVAVEAGRGPGGLEGHAELAAGDLFFHGFDIGAESEEELGDAGDDAGFVVTDEGDGGETMGHDDFGQD